MDEYVSRVEAMRREKDHWFRHDAGSPIPDRARFRGLAYYPVDPALRFRVALVEHAAPSEITIPTSDGDARRYVNVGRFEVRIGGAPVQIQAYRSEGQHGVFVPFRDKTSGKETYGAGRYLDLEPGADGLYEVDFNLAYNPSCAYDDAYSCPMPPPENWLQVAIPAGERVYVAP